MLSCTTDGGLCVIRYARDFVQANLHAFSIESFERDNHSATIIATVCNKNEMENSFGELRRDIVCIISHLNNKYTTVRDEDHALSCTIPLTDDSSCMSEPSRCDTSVSESQSASESDTSDDEWIDEPNDCNSHTSEDYNVDDDDDNDTLSDDGFAHRQYHSASSTATSRDNLLCPGDVVEYKTIKKPGPAKRSSIATIVDSGASRSVILRNSVVLKPREHVVRKVKMYCGATEYLISNPLAEWIDIHDCVLQEGTLLSADEDDSSDSDASSHGGTNMDED